ncbi:MAG: HigA family addiction module antitoxin [Brevinematales bacterium]
MNITERRPLHPGQLFLEGVLKPIDMTLTEAAKRLGVTRQSMDNLVHGRVDLSFEMAMRIALATGTSPESWYNGQLRLNIWRMKYEKKPLHVTKIA